MPFPTYGPGGFALIRQIVKLPARWDVLPPQTFRPSLRYVRGSQRAMLVAHEKAVPIPPWRDLHCPA